MLKITNERTLKFLTRHASKESGDKVTIEKVFLEKTSFQIMFIHFVTIFSDGSKIDSRWCEMYGVEFSDENEGQDDRWYSH